MTAKGKAFEREVAAAYRELGYFVHRIVDNTYGQPGKSMRSTKTPADFIFVGPTSTHLVEAKSTKAGTLPLVRVSDHQRHALTTFPAHGLLATCFTVKGKRECYVAAMSDVLIAAHTADRKSVTSVMMNEIGVRCPKVKGGWDFSPVADRWGY